MTLGLETVCLGARTGGDDLLRDFWHAAEAGGWFQEMRHPVCDLDRCDWSQPLPIVWHWDEIKIARSSGGDVEALVVSWSSCVATRRDVSMIRFPFCQI